MLQKLYAQADNNGGTLRNQVYFLLDEFANIGQIPDFNKKLSTTRSLGISISIVVQSLDQLSWVTVILKYSWEVHLLKLVNTSKRVWGKLLLNSKVDQ